MLTLMMPLVGWAPERASWVAAGVFAAVMAVAVAGVLMADALWRRQQAQSPAQPPGEQADQAGPPPTIAETSTTHDGGRANTRER